MSEGRYRLGSRRSPAAGLSGAWALLPIGATEAHGPHLPLDTDVCIAEALADRVAARLDAEGSAGVVLPPLNYGITEFARGFPGTLSVDASLVQGLVVGLGRAVRRQGAAGLILVNAHFEPAELGALFGAAAQLEADGLRVVYPNFASRRGSHAFADLCPLDGHAGRYETSLVLAAAPERVVGHQRLSRVEADLAAGIARGASSFEEAGGEQGYFGDPAGASAALGVALYERLTALVVGGIS